MPEDIDSMFVTNDKGQQVPYSAFMKIEMKQGLNEISRYNLYPTAPIQGAPAKGYSSGQAIAAVKEVGVKMPVIVRLEGTNADLARQMLAKSGLAITAARDLTDAATKAVSLTGAHS